MRRQRLSVVALALVPVLAGLAGLAGAHEIRPGYLELTEKDPRRFDVVWKVPTRGELRLSLDPVFPATCEQATPIAAYPLPGAVVERWTIHCPDDLVGHEIRVAGLEATLTDVLLRVDLLAGGAQTARLGPSSPSHELKAAPGRWEVARTYLVLGFEHILGGIDHLLFVLALLLIVEGRRRLVGTVTAFTVAHSITLGLATLGFVNVPQAPVEAVIALSILFLASEIARSRIRDGDGAPGLTERYPWIVAFTFGLLHGFGFAGALSEVGLPEAEIPLALLLFNVGVELGQLAFVFAALVVVFALRRLMPEPPAWAWRVPTYAIGCLAAFWTIERVVGFFGDV